MCLAVPYTIKEVFNDTSAVAVSGAVRVEIRTDLVEPVVPGDTVLVHAGFAIEKLEAEDSKELNALWEELRTLAGDPYAH